MSITKSCYGPSDQAIRFGHGGRYRALIEEDRGQIHRLEDWAADS